MYMYNIWITLYLLQVLHKILHIVESFKTDHDKTKEQAGSVTDWMLVAMVIDR